MSMRWMMADIGLRVQDALSPRAQTAKEIIMAVALFVMIAGMLCAWDMLRLKSEGRRKLEDIKPRHLISICMVFVAVAAIAYSSDLATFVTGL